MDKVSGEIKNIWDLMNTSYDKFIRTTDEDHEKQVKKIFKKMYAKGDIYKGHYEGMYCTPVSPSLQNPSLWTASVRTADAPAFLQRKRRISLR